MRRAQFRARFRFGVLSDNGAFAGAAGFLKRPQRPQSARVVGRSHQDALRLRLPQILAHPLERGLELPVAVDVHRVAGLRNPYHLGYAR